MARTRIACFLMVMVFSLAGLAVPSAKVPNYDLKIQTAVPSASSILN